MSSSKTVFTEMLSAHFPGETSDGNKRMQDHLENILDIRYTSNKQESLSVSDIFHLSLRLLVLITNSYIHEDVLSLKDQTFMDGEGMLKIDNYISYNDFIL